LQEKILQSAQYEMQDYQTKNLWIYSKDFVSNNHIDCLPLAAYLIRQLGKLQSLVIANIVSDND
jgi:hypothetical protein